MKFLCKNKGFLHDLLLLLPQPNTRPTMLPIMLDHSIQQANVSTLRAGCLAARRRRTLALKQAIQKMQRKCE